MKVTLTIVFCALLSSSLFAQTQHIDGQTLLINPSGRTLVIERDNADSWLTFHDPNDYWFSFGIDRSNGGKLSLNHGGDLTSSQFVMDLNGNIGIGTSTPYYKLDVAGSWAFRQDGYFYNSSAYAYESATDQYLHFRTWQGKGYVGMQSSNSLILQSNGGFVGIGTLNPGHKLDVRGTIRAMEVKVDVNVPADYVFSENYPLRSLEEVESFVKTNQHLPGIPSAEIIQESGWEIGEMSNKLLEKIEELTLYMIKFNKELQILQEENKALKERLELRQNNFH